MRSIVSSLGLMGVLLGLAMPVSAEVLLQAGATETKLVTSESHRSMRHQLTAEAGKTVAIKLRLANNNPGIVSRVAVYQAGKYTPLKVENQVSYRTVDPAQKSKISHLIVLTLPGESASGEVNYEIEPLFDYDGSPQFEVDRETAEHETADRETATAAVNLPSTVRYRMTVATATVSQRLLLDAQARQTEQDYEGAIALYTRAINLNPDIADFYAQRGSAYLALGEQEDVSPAVQQAIVTDWETAAQLYEQVGHGTAANALRSQLSQVVEQNKD
ncbi:tetratricopeptide repeat protein [Leptolyngbya cf. ectocarpi LEGE 11479]|uniref:Tetratricopeptide repeat protein n=1 Tax=Leptolyngbya cf. ectocarpi LEGE 11479 TaxID=1828722 RepID=A0A928X3L0_LEPEC|nr:tetratricopeptide repeat protein [Leptolyngbya ectocarpi]MBE9066438.1 tetratricopeptide repeat protein [Leptolyngbya cf. ectocarpi LEGE 11479]